MAPTASSPGESRPPMPDLYEWEAALAVPLTVTVESSQDLLLEVRDKQAQQDAYLAGRNRVPPPRKPLATVQQFAPSKTIQFTPIHLLNRLGVITTPAIENLADLCSTWAYYRY